ncbi:MAG: hypothetical protein NXI00_01300 [Cytophagales bacterium]|nr:hypothetical protein [Cytophagales bacterium]
MKYLTFKTTENAIIEIENDFTGKETVYYNGEEVSAIRSIMGGIHTFEVVESDEKVNYQVELSLNIFTGIGFQIKRNGEDVFNNAPSFSNNENNNALVLWIIALFFAGAVIGYLLVKGDSQFVPWVLLGLIITWVINYFYTKNRSKKESL